MAVNDVAIVVGQERRDDDKALVVRLFLRRLFWLIVEVAKCNVAVVKLLLARKVKISQEFVEISVSTNSDLAQVIFANSITLTPGTVTVETENNSLLVHVLNLDNNTESELGNMGQRVSSLEK